MVSSTPGKRPDDIENLKGTVAVRKRTWLRRMFAFLGPAYLVSVGYMDPGNWATDIEGGARFGYMLIWILLASNLMAILLQTLSARLGIVTGYDLAQGCRREYPKRLNIFLWILAEIAIAATDLAELLGTIIGLNLLFGLPLLWGAAITAFDTFLLLAIQRLGIRKMEAFIITLIVTIGACFLVEIFLAQPDWGGILHGFVPHFEPAALYITIGIIGATVMPHNLYLHSSLVQSRSVSDTYTGKAEASKFNLFDSAIALNAAFFVNAAILIMAAALFHSRGILVTEIQQAHKLLEPILGTTLAPAAFAIALIAAGQSSTLTGTLTGQIIMEGFLNIRIRPWLRRVITRSIALLPAVIVIAISGSHGTYKLLIFSQVILSLQLPFATIPLIHFTSDPGKMGKFANAIWVKILAWLIAAIIISLNLKLVLDELTGWLSGGPLWIWFLVLPVVIFLLGILGYIIISPFFGVKKQWESGIIKKGHIIAEKLKPVTYKNLAVAVENSELDAAILSTALSLAKANHIRLTLIHVAETPGTMVYGNESSSLHIRQDENYLLELTRELEGKNLPVEYMLLHGDPSAELIKYINENDFDLLVAGSHGHHGVQDWIHGTTVDKVRHGIKIPVFIVRN
ncbi:MAG: Nramp family divalent metal transporter [Bacteroidales bacterium]|nr:Nramp family divalent metal transporter [Bacteroidales bacterium]